MIIHPEAWFVVLLAMRVKRTNVSEKGNTNSCIALNLLESRSFSKEGGYSLVELIVTIILIGIAFPGLLGFLTNSMFDTIENDIINKAVLYAGEKMEQITADKNEPTRGIGYITTPNQYPSESIGEYTRSVTIQNIILNNIDLTEVIVIVDHPFLKNPLTLNHIFAEYDGN
jgi:type II secretory pathway pseudopilin PulG